jgi:DNA helicase HerA-like ATPase
MRKDEETPSVQRFNRADFISEYFHYKPGEHVTILGPTGTGKTYLAFQLMEEVTSPELQGVVLVMKPKDDTAKEFTKRAGYRLVRTWPPSMSIYQPRKPPGFTLWPRFTFKPREDNIHLADQFERALLESYRKGHRVVFGDEAYSLDKELGLGPELVTVWTKGRSMECGLWVASQKPTHIPLHAYNQVQHLFLAFDPDKKARERFDEIGGVDPNIVRDTVAKLGKHEWLYIGRDGPVMAIVEEK